jgi:hypothetical protein
MNTETTQLDISTLPDNFQTKRSPLEEEREINKLANKRTLRKYYRTIVAPKRGYFQIDLLDISNLSNKQGNKGNKFILCCVDIYSRYAWAFPLHDKSIENVLPSIKAWLKDVGNEGVVPVVVQSDAGSEFKGAVDRFFKDNNIIHTVVDIGDHNSQSIVESFNRTLRIYLRSYMTMNGNFIWMDVLDDVLQYYNEKTHSTTKASPKDVWEGKAIPVVRMNKYKNDLDIGDTVRVLTNRTIFDKGSSTHVYSTNVYKVKAMDGFKYILDGLTGRYSRWQLQKSRFDASGNKPEPVKELKQAIQEKRIAEEFKREDIQPSNIIVEKRELRPRKETEIKEYIPKIKKEEVYYEVEKILDEKKVRGKYEYLVKWKGFAEPTWEPFNNLKWAKEAIDNYRKEKRKH